MRIEPIHPGEHLAEILEGLRASPEALARAMRVPPSEVRELLGCRSGVTADTALRLGRALGMTPEFWMNLQQRYDLEVARAGTDISGLATLVDDEAVVSA